MLRRSFSALEKVVVEWGEGTGLFAASTWSPSSLLAAASPPPPPPPFSGVVAAAAAPAACFASAVPNIVNTHAHAHSAEICSEPSAMSICGSVGSHGPSCGSLKTHEKPFRYSLAAIKNESDRAIALETQ